VYINFRYILLLVKDNCSDDNDAMVKMNDFGLKTVTAKRQWQVATQYEEGTKLLLGYTEVA